MVGWTDQKSYSVQVQVLASCVRVASGKREFTLTVLNLLNTALRQFKHTKQTDGINFVLNLVLNLS